MNAEASSKAASPSIRTSPISGRKLSLTALSTALFSWYSNDGVCSVAPAFFIASQSCSKYERSQFNSSLLLPTPAVRTITPMPSGISNCDIACLSSSRSSPSIRRDMPPALGLFGIRTIYRPAKLRYEVSAAPLLPRSSFSTCTIISVPSRIPSPPFCWYSRPISLIGRKPWRSAPKSTKAASRLCSTRVILAL